MLNKRKKIALSFLLATLVSETAHSTETKYDCTAEETLVYVNQVSSGLFSPTPVTSVESFKKSYMEQAQAEAEATGNDSCVTIFSDGKLKDDWKDIVDDVRNINVDISFSSVDAAFIKSLLDRIKNEVRNGITNAFEQLGKDICNMLSTDNLKKELLDEVNKKYGLNARSLRIKDFADSMTKDAIRNADDNIKLLISEDAMAREVSAETRKRVRKIEKSLWGKI
jgi:predicted hydrocarbon binding protein